MARTLTDLVTVEAAKQEALAVLSGAEIRSLAELESEKAAMGCDDSSCLAELAGALGARYVLTGRVAALGELKILQLSVFDAEKGVPIFRKAINAKSIEQFIEVLPPAVDEILRPLNKKSTPASATPPPSTTADPPSETTSTQSAQSLTAVESPPPGTAGPDPLPTPAPPSPTKEGGGLSGILLGVAGVAALGGALAVVGAVVGFAFYFISIPNSPVAIRWGGLFGGGTAALVAIVALGVGAGTAGAGLFLE